MSNPEVVRHALISTTDKAKVRKLGFGLTKIGGWQLHSYGETLRKLRGELPRVDGEEVIEGLPLDKPLPVSGVEMFIGEYDESDRRNLSARLAEHIRKSPNELKELGLPSIDLLYMNPVIALEEIRRRLDSNYLNMMTAAIETGKIVIAKMRDVDAVVDWLSLGEPEGHEVSLAILRTRAEEEVDHYQDITRYRMGQPSLSHASHQAQIG